MDSRLILVVQMRPDGALALEVLHTAGLYSGAGVFAGGI